MRSTFRAGALRPAWALALAASALSSLPALRAAVGAPQLFPRANATAVCPDTPLHLTFASPPTLGAGGKIEIFDAATRALVESIDVSSPTAEKTIGGLDHCRYYPVIVAGNEASIYPRNGVLAWNKTYYVTIEPGVFLLGSDRYAGLDGAAAWSFTTKAEAPPRGATKLTVAADGTGDFCTVQGALDFIPAGNTTPTTIFIRKGVYTEIIFFTNKHALTLRGEDRHETVIAYANNARFNASGGNPYATATPNPSAVPTPHVGSIYHRGVFMAHRVSDLVLTNLTIHDTTPKGGSQAEAIILNGTTTARAIVTGVDLFSYQDTLQINGQAYVSNCRIEGDVDFMWGNGPSFFENCVCRSLSSRAFYTQIRNPGQKQLENHGFVFLHCTLDGAPGVANNYLSRIETSRFPNSEVVLIDCVLGSSVRPEGWQLERSEKDDGKTDDGKTPKQVRFWEYHSHAADGTPVDVGGRAFYSRQLNLPADAATIANYSDPTFVLGHGWDPRRAAVFAP
jgi:pectin methylesterase-like acyl-CoA thioesterase